MDPECRSANSECSEVLESGATIHDRQAAEGHHLTWQPCCGQTPEPGRCDSYRLDKSDTRRPAKIQREQYYYYIYIILYYYFNLTLSIRLSQPSILVNIKKKVVFYKTLHKISIHQHPKSALNIILTLYA